MMMEVFKRLLPKNNFYKMKLFFSILFFFVASITNAQDYQSFPLWNYKLSFEQRVNDLVSRLTLEEKVAQMMNHAPAIPKLGITAYDWWNEVLHGVARTPYHVTVFPQAIGLSATWNTVLMNKVANTIADEAKQRGIRQVLSPVINIASDVAKRVFDGGSLYCSTKFAQDAFSAALRKEVRKDGIKVSVVYSGLVDTPFHADPYTEGKQTWLTAEDMANSIIFIIQ